MDGEPKVVEHFKMSKAFWAKFFEANRNADVAALAHALGDAQGSFEIQTDWDRALAKEIFAYTCLGYLYDTHKGFDNNKPLAKRVVDAFDKSICSLEVKSSAREAAELFSLTDD